MTKEDPVHHGIVWSLLGSPHTPAKARSSPGQGHRRPAGTPVLQQQLWRGVCVWRLRSDRQQQGDSCDWLTNTWRQLRFMTLHGEAQSTGVILRFCSRTWNQRHPWTTSGAMTSGEVTWAATLVTNPTDLSLSWLFGKNIHLLYELTPSIQFDLYSAKVPKCIISNHFTLL